MVELPSGTVTLVFTDIEGSTRLLASLGSRYEAVLAEHRRLLRAAFQSHAGIEVDTQGDALFYAFAKAHDAVTAAVAAQRALASHDFGEGVELKVRMGIHTGEPTVTEEGYVGPDVHLGARISAVAWGAQIVVSSATAGLLSPGLEDVTLRSLGDHALKDIDKRVELFQVMAPGLIEDFPALRTKGTHPTNLPPRLASLIGREQDLAALKELLASPETSVVTVVGPGGTGKTSLAAALGAQLLSKFPNGVFFVDLSALNDPALVIPALAHTLALKETPGRTLQQSLSAHLSSKDMLVILDNFEQVIDSAPEVSALLTEAPGLKVVITSREALRIQAERVVSLSPLELPSEDHDDLEEVARSAAVALFTERARAVKQDFALTEDNAPEVAAICRRLDGLPLALELAAARINLLSPSSLLARLDHGLKLLTSGKRDATQRQKTLRGAISWSYELLSKDEQRLFYRLAVFAGGWSFEAAEQVCDRGDLTTDVLDGLASLVDKSLVRAAGEQERLSMLETIREFALEMLEESGEAEELRRAHAEFFRALAEEAEPHTSQGDEQIMWLRRLELELDNIRTALEFLADFGEPEIQLRMASALRHFWRFHGHLSEWRIRLQTALWSATADQALRERALAGLGLLAYLQGDHGKARRHLEEALLIEQQNNLWERVAGTLNDLGLVAQAEGDFAGAKVLYEETIRAARDLGDTFLVALGTLNLADLALIEGDFEHAALLSIETLSLARELGDTEGIAISLANGGVAALKRGRLDQAREMLGEALPIAMELGSHSIIAGCIGDFAAIAAGSGRLHEAARLLGAAKELRESIGIATGGFEAELEQATLFSLGASLGRVTLEQAFHEGELLTAEEAMTEALHVGSSSGVDIDGETKD